MPCKRRERERKREKALSVISPWLPIRYGGRKRAEWGCNSLLFYPSERKRRTPCVQGEHFVLLAICCLLSKQRPYPRRELQSLHKLPKHAVETETDIGETSKSCCIFVQVSQHTGIGSRRERNPKPYPDNRNSIRIRPCRTICNYETLETTWTYLQYCMTR